MLDRPHAPGTAEPGLHLVDHEHDAVLVADPAHAAQELPRRDDESALALDGLDDDRGDLLGGDLRDERALEVGERLGRGRAAVVLGERHPVDLRRERAEARLVGVRLRGEAHREERAPVEAALEGDHGRPLRVRARELDRVLDRLRPGVEERGAGLAADRRKPAKALRQGDVDLVGDDREVGVAEALELLLRGGDDPRVRVADVEAADAAGEVEERVSVDVGEERPPPFLDHDRQVDRERLGDDALLAVQDLARARARNLGPEVDRTGGRHCGGAYRSGWSAG